jgi:hypothetical protein
MQLLPSTFHSPPVESLRDSLREAEKWSRSIASDLLSFIGAGRLYVAYGGGGYAEASAYTFYWFLRVLAPRRRAVVHSLEELTYHVLAYREPEEAETIVAFVEEGEENNLARLADAARLTGAKLVAVTPPIPPVIEARLGQQSMLVELPPGRPSVYSLVLASLLGYRVASEEAHDSERFKRLGSEVGNYLEVLQDIATRYAGLVNELVEVLETANPLLVSYTPTMRPPAALLESIASNKLPILREPVSSTLARLVRYRNLPPSLVIMKTDVEEDMVRELKFKLSMLLPSRQPRIVELHVRTDPLTAPIYASIIIELVRDKLK